jgi:hypothetical protein
MESPVPKTRIQIFRACRKCAIGAVAVGTAGTIAGEFAAAMAQRSHVSLYINVDQPHDNREPKAPTPTRAIEIAAVSTAASTAGMMFSIPSSIASSPHFWFAPKYPTPGRDYMERPALTFKST